MKTCCFFGHAEMFMCSLSSLKNCIENEIKNGFTRFMVGDHGRFDFEVKNLLVGLKREYKNIELVWVLTSVNKYVELEKERRNYSLMII